MSEAELNIDGYELINCVSTGGSSQVWEVRKEGGAEQLAMKLLLPEATSDPDAVRALKHEARVLKSLDHPNFVKFQDVRTSKKNCYMVMDFFRAPNLKTLIKNDLTAVHVRAEKLIESLCLALSYLHERGWLHKDVKPDNILFNKGSELRLIDFSLAVRAPSSLAKVFSGKVKAIQGTRTYIAPETLMRKQPSIQTDMYSLGVTLFEMLTGTPPFSGATPNDLLRKHVGEPARNPSDLNANVSPEMDELVLKLLSKKPANRPNTMDEVMVSVRSIKIFKEDVQEMADKSQREAEERQRASLDATQRLDSRADAELTELLKADPEAAKLIPKRPARVTRPSAASVSTSSQQSSSQQSTPQPVPQPVAPPNAPGMGYPGMPGPMPMYPPQPGAMYPGYQMPPGYPGMHSPPPMPHHPPAGSPPQGPPPVPPGSPSPSASPPPSPQSGAPSTPSNTPPSSSTVEPHSAQPPTATPNSASTPPPSSTAEPGSVPPPASPAPDPPAQKDEKASDEDDLPFMDELPPVI